MKRANIRAGFILFGAWLTTSAIAYAGGAFFGAAVTVRAGRAFRNTALVRDATISRRAAALGRTALVRDATRFGAWRGVPLRPGDGWRFGAYGYRSRYGYGNHRDRFDRRLGGYPDGAGYNGYANPYGYGYGDPYGYGYLDNNDLYPGNYDTYAYPPEYAYQAADAVPPMADAPESGYQAADAAPPATTGVGLVTAVQTKLTRQAYYDGPLDGVINAKMRRALREYQQDHGLPATGLINPELLSSMAIRYVSPLS